MTLMERIGAVASGRSDCLDASGFDLTELPEAVYGLHTLRELRVNNQAYRSHQFMIDLLKNHPSDPALLKHLEDEEQDRLQELRIPRLLERLDDRIGQLASLEVLDLSYNQLRELPESLGQLPRLRRLLLNDNQLRALPASLTRLEQLEVLQVRENPLEHLPDFPTLHVYEPYQAFCQSQKEEAMRHQDYDWAVWLRQQEIRYGLVW